jgi:preprotein translocase subunit SecF
MQWLSRVPNINFMRWRRVAIIGSTVGNLIAILTVIIFGLNYGVDFTGGVILEVTYPGEANVQQIRQDLEEAGYASPQVQNFGSVNDVLIRLPPTSASEEPAELEARLMGILQAHDPNVMKQRLETVGSQVGEDLAQQSGLAMLFALIMIFIYVSLRFRWKLALGAIVATAHDVLITVGFFAVFRWQFDLTVLGAVLAVLGYSLNDTIVLYDRIRDNFRSMRRSSSEAIVNASVNQTLSRTIVTGGTTLLTVIALFLFGGDTLHGFSLALIIGILVGTYSSIYVASSMALVLKITGSDMVAATKQEQVDGLP